ncbi:MAG: hypothetical protein MHM6MM_005302 [Cercozoa sp. M6MM]
MRRIRCLSDGTLARGLVAVVVLVVIITFATIKPIRQDQKYHDFADKRSCFVFGKEVHNCADVLTNLAFSVVGILGAARVVWCRVGGYPCHAPLSVWSEKACFAVFFLGVFAVAPGSAYYHWDPNDDRLVWDRLPMTVAFMSLFAIVLSERVPTLFWRRQPRQSSRISLPSRRTSFNDDIDVSYLPDSVLDEPLHIEPPCDTSVARFSPLRHMIALVLLLVVGVISVVVWALVDDLRLYVLVQFLPMPILAVLMLARKASPPFLDIESNDVIYTRTDAASIAALVLYGGAKITELLDNEIFDATNGVIGGHAIKHLLAALAVTSYAWLLGREQRVVGPAARASLLGNYDQSAK